MLFRLFRDCGLVYCGKVVSYIRRNDSITDKNLIQLFRTIGFNILSDDPKLFFTNLVMGYRLQGTSGGFKTAWANADAPFFRRLVDIIHPRVLLCLGKDTFRCTLRALGLQHLPVIRNYNRFIESSENPVKIHLCDGETALVFALAHCGVMGTCRIRFSWLQRKAHPKGSPSPDQPA